MMQKLEFVLINETNMYSAICLAKELFSNEIDKNGVFQPGYSYKFAFEEGNRTCWYYLIKKENTTIGTIGYYRSRSHPKENELWIGYLGIKKEFRKNGLGYQMVNELVEDIQRKHSKVNTIKLFTSNLDATKDGHWLYPKLGFTLYRKVQTKPYETCYFKKMLKIPG